MPQRFRRSSRLPASGLSPVRRSVKVAVATTLFRDLEKISLQHRFLQHVAPDVDHVIVVREDDAEAVEALLAAETVDGARQARVLPAGAGVGLGAARNLAAKEMFGLGADLFMCLGEMCVPLPGIIEHYRVAYARSGALQPFVFNGPLTHLEPGDDIDTMDGERAQSLVDPHPRRLFPPVGEVMSNSDHHLFDSENFAVSSLVWAALGGFTESLTHRAYVDLDFAERAAALGAQMAWVGGAHALRRYSDRAKLPQGDLSQDVQHFADRWGYEPRWCEYGFAVPARSSVGIRR